MLEAELTFFCGDNPGFVGWRLSSQTDLVALQLFLMSLIRAIILSWTQELESFCLVKQLPISF